MSQSNYDIDFETAEASVALNAVFWRLAVALGEQPDVLGTIRINMNALLERVEEQLWRLSELEK